MAEIQPPVSQINGGGQLMLGSSETVGTKRQRRPSVRLGEIGGDPPPYDARRTSTAAKQWKPPPPPESNRKDSSKSSKARPSANLSSGGDFHETLDGEDREANLDSVAIGSWRVKDGKKRASSFTKRVRSNWASSKIDEGGGDDEYRGFDAEGSESPVKDQSPNHSSENVEVYTRRPIRARVSEGRDNNHHDGVEISGPSDNDQRDWNGRGRCGDDGVSNWLNGLGLGRYVPVFEIHEVDEEVLPMLTLEDLKDMGINAVGSRRKMYSAIQKLGKGFS